MLDRPGEGERAAEIVRHEIERPLDRGGVQESFDELRQAVERTLEIGRHFRMAEARQIRRDAAIMRREALGDALPHDAAVRIAMEQENRRSGAPFGHVDIGVTDADSARRGMHGLVYCHRHAPLKVPACRMG